MDTINETVLSDTGINIVTDTTEDQDLLRTVDRTYITMFDVSTNVVTPTTDDSDTNREVLLTETILTDTSQETRLVDLGGENDTSRETKLTIDLSYDASMSVTSNESADFDLEEKIVYITNYQMDLMRTVLTDVDLSSDIKLKLIDQFTFDFDTALDYVKPVVVYSDTQRKNTIELWRYTTVERHVKKVIEVLTDTQKVPAVNPKHGITSFVFGDVNQGD